jgi:hypothetical protein
MQTGAEAVRGLQEAEEGEPLFLQGPGGRPFDEVPFLPKHRLEEGFFFRA